MSDKFCKTIGSSTQSQAFFQITDMTMFFEQEKGTSRLHSIRLAYLALRKRSDGLVQSGWEREMLRRIGKRLLAWMMVLGRDSKCLFNSAG
jgi:hypothetical protein